MAGRYRLETQLGEGGMGVVYRARHVLIDRVVALKLIRPDLRGETHLRAWMLREARAANRVDHAHIVDIHDVGETEDGELYLVMEYLVGESLSTEVCRGPMDIARAVDVLEQMCAALARAHDLGVVHRDLKSDNIMLLVRGGRKDFVKILDFGLAALTRDPRLAPKGAVFGTPEYMSPEQARGEDATASSDLYALGILFFEMVTGRLPFRSNDRDTLLEMQRTGPAPSVRSVRADLPEAAERIVHKLLEKGPADRFRDGHHLQDELKALQRMMPSKAWDVRSSDAQPAVQAAPPPPPPAPSPGVVEWSRRASNFLRLVSRAYPDGHSPEAVRNAGDRMWELAARASRLEGELSSHSKRLEAMERRGRGLRAEIGRKVEELSHEESRMARDASSELERAAAVERSIREAEQQYATAEKDVQTMESSGNLAGARGIYEHAAYVRSRMETLREVQKEYEQVAREREEHASGLRRQVGELRKQLQQQGEALEADLQSGRERIATRVREALSYERAFTEASAILIRHLKDRPECRELMEELSSEMGEGPEASSTSGDAPQAEVTLRQLQA